MTKDADFKRLVRERMTRTDENYTQARAALQRPSERIARAERDAVLRRVMPAGRLVEIPVKRRTRAAVLLELALGFEPGRDYPEREVSRLLGRVHPDVASLRRYLVEYGYLTRQNSVYRLCEVLPSRSANQAQEVPGYEQEVLLAHGVRVSRGSGGPVMPRHSLRRRPG